MLSQVCVERVVEVGARSLQAILYGVRNGGAYLLQQIIKSAVYRIKDETAGKYEVLFSQEHRYQPSFYPF